MERKKGQQITEQQDVGLLEAEVVGGLRPAKCRIKPWKPLGTRDVRKNHLHVDTNNFLETAEESGPRVLFCADKSIDLMLKSAASQYVKFKSIDASFIEDGDKKLRSVPNSRAAIFKDKTLSLLEKNQQMRFFKLV
ncbi:hypothetical protein LWI29_000165 [Acer saccharum]|uniref:Uncharacterized protein n=1 Tax=Acer saccharum TaxID=4024 RepID=A0AA39TKI4_ACESA|nr:hypothetical protein LWI29_000165 [Acer saccharum]